MDLKKIPEGFDPSLVREHYRVRQAFGKGWQDDFLVPAETTYHYDAAGNLARETTRNAGAGLRVEKRYGHDGLGRLTEVVAEGGAVRHFAYDGLDRKVFSGRRGGNFHAYGTLALYDGRRSVYEQDSAGRKHGTRTWLPLDEELTGEVLHRSVAGGNPEFVSREHLPEETASMSMHVDRLGSTVFAADKYGRALTGYGYSEFGEVYVRKRGLGGRFVPRTAKVPEEVLNRETVNRLYTGGTQEQLSGLVHLDARHYSPAKTKFVQPDPYSLTELSLPEEARHTLVKAAGLTLEGLLADPAQQLSNSYVSNNPLRWVDPLGLWKLSIGASLLGSDVNVEIYDSDSGFTGEVSTGESTTILGAGFTLSEITPSLKESDKGNLSITHGLSKYASYGFNSRGQIQISVGKGIGFPGINVSLNHDKLNRPNVPAFNRQRSRNSPYNRCR